MNKIFNLLQILFISMLWLLSFSQAKAQNSENEIWIDVRTIQEYQQGHLDGALNIPHMEIQQRIREITGDKKATIHLYCVAGVRAQIAKNALESLGYQNVINEGGLKDIQAKTSE